MSSRDSRTIQPVDLLILDGLHNQVEGAVPSPGVWKRIRRRARALSTRHPAHYGWRWGGFEFVSESSEATMGCTEPWMYGPVALRFLDTSMMFRFAW